MDLLGMGCGDAVTSEFISLGILLEVWKGTGITFDALHEVGNTTGCLGGVGRTGQAGATCRVQ